MFGRTLFVTVGILCGLLLGSPVQARGGHLRQLSRIKVKSGYIDAHFAVSPDGKTLAYVHVGEGQARTTLNIVSLAGQRHRRLARVDITKNTVAPVLVAFTPDSARVFVVAEMSQKVTQPPRQAWFYDRNGRAAGKLTRFTHLAFRKVGSAWQIVGYLRSVTGQRAAHEVTLYNAATLRRIKSARLVSSPSGAVTKPRMEIAYWAPDFTRFVAKVAGAYDRKRDVRLPDREKIYDPFTRKFVTDKEIGNLAEWAKLRKIRAKAQHVPTLLRLTGTQKSFVWEMITRDHRRVVLPDLAPPLKRFNFKSLVQQPTYGSKVPFSLTVDPQWPTLFGDKRNVEEVFHLFLLDPATRRATPLGTVPSPKQVLGWRLGGQRLVVMRLHRFWKLGHRELEIYRVPGNR